MLRCRRARRCPACIARTPRRASKSCCWRVGQPSAPRGTWPTQAPRPALPTVRSTCVCTPQPLRYRFLGRPAVAETARPPPPRREPRPLPAPLALRAAAAAARPRARQPDVEQLHRYLHDDEGREHHGRARVPAVLPVRCFEEGTRTLRSLLALSVPQPRDGSDAGCCVTRLCCRQRVTCCMTPDTACLARGACAVRASVGTSLACQEQVEPRRARAAGSASTTSSSPTTTRPATRARARSRASRATSRPRTSRSAPSRARTAR
jgi:hypothetical protein